MIFDKFLICFNLVSRISAYLQSILSAFFKDLDPTYLLRKLC